MDGISYRQIFEERGFAPHPIAAGQFDSCFPHPWRAVDCISVHRTVVRVDLKVCLIALPSCAGPASNGLEEMQTAAGCILDGFVSAASVEIIIGAAKAITGSSTPMLPFS